MDALLLGCACCPNPVMLLLLGVEGDAAGAVAGATALAEGAAKTVPE